MKFLVFLICSFLVFSGSAWAQKGAKVQKMNFDETDVSGKVRQPDGSYIVQKRGIDFIPLYKLKENFDEQIEDSVDFIK